MLVLRNPLCLGRVTNQHFGGNRDSLSLTMMTRKDKTFVCSLLRAMIILICYNAIGKVCVLVFFHIQLNVLYLGEFIFCTESLAFFTYIDQARTNSLVRILMSPVRTSGSQEGIIRQPPLPAAPAKGFFSSCVSKPRDH